MKNSACSSSIGTPTKLSMAINSQNTNVNQNSKPSGDCNIGGQQQAILNIDPDLNEKLSKINQANENDLAGDGIGEGSEGELNEEDDDQGQEEAKPKRIVATVSNRDG